MASPERNPVEAIDRAAEVFVEAWLRLRARVNPSRRGNVDDILRTALKLRDKQTAEGLNAGAAPQGALNAAATPNAQQELPIPTP